MEIICENKNCFTARRRVSSNNRLVLDTVGYSNYVNPYALLVYFDFFFFYKELDSTEYSFIMQAQRINNNVFYKDIITRSFSVQHVQFRGVWEGCPVSWLLLLIIADLLYLNISHCPSIQGLTIFRN